MTKIVVTDDTIRITGHAKNSTVCNAISAISEMLAMYIESHYDDARVFGTSGFLKICGIPKELRGSPLIVAAVEEFRRIAYDYPNDVILEI